MQLQQVKTSTKSQQRRVTAHPWLCRFLAAVATRGTDTPSTLACLLQRQSCQGRQWEQITGWALPVLWALLSRTNIQRGNVKTLPNSWFTATVLWNGSHQQTSSNLSPSVWFLPTSSDTVSWDSSPGLSRRSSSATQELSGQSGARRAPTETPGATENIAGHLLDASVPQKSYCSASQCCTMPAEDPQLLSAAAAPRLLDSCKSWQLIFTFSQSFFLFLETFSKTLLGRATSEQPLCPPQRQSLSLR